MFAAKTAFSLNRFFLFFFIFYLFDFVLFSLSKPSLFLS